MEMIEMAFDYLTPTFSLAALGDITTQTIVIAADADFQATWLIADSTGAFTCRFQDGSTGRYFQNRPVNNVNLFGTAQLPFPMLPPYVFKRQGSIILDFVNALAGPNTIQVVFRGKKLFASQAAGSAGVIKQ